ncbi:MAG TPA: cytochrome oxidase small assembly protein [Burkholderiaceae bacterium]|nr:cytochrome oxidase small assembly protein [Burkholderiaceae bacterium]
MSPESDERRHNRRTALILASVVLVFFIGVIARRWLVGG